MASVPDNATSQYDIGVACLRAGRLAEAASRFAAAIRLDPGHFEAHVNLAVTLREMRRPAEAVAASDRAIALRPDSAVAHFNRGGANRDLGRWDAALSDYDAAVRIEPDFAEAHAARGLVLGRLGRWDGAVDAHQRAVALRPGEAVFHYNLGVAQQASGNLDRAIECFDRCLALSPGNAQAMASRGGALAGIGRIDEALADLDEAVAARPDDPKLLYNRGAVLDKAFRLEPALADYARALSIQPSFPECAYNMALILLLLGRFESAWPVYEWRFQVPAYPGRRRRFAQPRWTGDDLNGRTLLIHAEQGLGDAIQFCRYISLIKGGRVVLEVPPVLRPLMTGLSGVDELVTTADALPSFDVWCPMLSLPAMLGSRAETIPPPARLRVPDASDAVTKSGALRIGITWAGNPAHLSDRNRSMPLRYMLPWLRHTSRLYALQLQMSDADKELLKATPEIVYLGRDLAATAAAIRELDLIISVDTSIAHLAATLGKPTWILLPFRPDWRWQLGRRDSPWYPSVRLFRQSVAGNWDDVIENVSEALAGWPMPG